MSRQIAAARLLPASGRILAEDASENNATCLQRRRPQRVLGLLAAPGLREQRNLLPAAPAPVSGRGLAEQ